jgi:hypothetical protein
MPFARFSQCWPEWAGLAGVAVLDVALMRYTGFHLLTDWGPFIFIGLAIGVAVILRGLRWQQAGDISEYLALNFTATLLFCILTYVCMAMSGPWVDAPLLAFDRALGFDWLACFHAIVARPWLFKTLHLAYASIFVQPFYFVVLFGLMRQPDRMRELFRIIFVSLLLCCVGAILFPALGPFKLYGLESYSDFLHDMEKLHARRDLTFALSEMGGVIAFPSFHTILALAYAYGFRRTGAVGYLMAGLNGVMLLSVPFLGGHYIADMLGGVVTMLVALAIVRLPDWLRHKGDSDVFAGAGLEQIETRAPAGFAGRTGP